MSVSQLSIRRVVVMASIVAAVRTLPGMPSPSSRVRPAVPSDVPVVLGLVRELADYERALHEVEASEDQLAAALFPDRGEPAVFAHVAEADGEVVGVAIWFPSFSTWTGTHGIWLEDLYVTPAHRGSGLGQELLQHAGRRVRRAGMVAAGVVGARLERPEHRLLRVDRRHRPGRVDALPPRRDEPGCRGAPRAHRSRSASTSPTTSTDSAVIGSSTSWRWVAPASARPRTWSPRSSGVTVVTCAS